MRDTGIGIPKSQQAAIFEAFTQADGSDTRRFGGTGLGLTIAAQLVSLMDGRLWVDSDEGRGSSFTFVAWFGQPGAAERPDPPWGHAPLNVLVAHGHALTRSAFVERLAPWPVRVAEAAGGRAAMAALDVARDGGQAFDVVFVDAALPGLDGFELAARVKATPGLARQVVILLRTTHLATGAERAVAVGASCLTTPLIWQNVSEALASVTTGQASARPATGGPRITRRGLRVLVVDDHVVNQAVVSTALRKWGHAVASALDGQEAPGGDRQDRAGRVRPGADGRADAGAGRAAGHAQDSRP